jgi:hypothetical protein
MNVLEIRGLTVTSHRTRLVFVADGDHSHRAFFARSYEDALAILLVHSPAKTINFVLRNFQSCDIFDDIRVDLVNVDFRTAGRSKHALLQVCCEFDRKDILIRFESQGAFEFEITFSFSSLMTTFLRFLNFGKEIDMNRC